MPEHPTSEAKALALEDLRIRIKDRKAKGFELVRNAMLAHPDTLRAMGYANKEAAAAGITRKIMSEIERMITDYERTYPE